MFSAILILLLLPITDVSRSRGMQFRPLSKIAFYIFIANFLILMQLGAKHVESPFIEFGQISTVLYFLYFSVVMYSITLIENTFVDIHHISTNYSPTWPKLELVPVTRLDHMSPVDAIICIRKKHSWDIHCIRTLHEVNKYLDNPDIRDETMVAQFLYDGWVLNDKKLMAKYTNTSISVPEDILLTEENKNIFIFSHVEARTFPGRQHFDSWRFDSLKEKVVKVPSYPSWYPR
jgi:hypothetical protein